MRQRVLVAADNNATRVAFSAVLADAGFETIAVGSVQTALRALDEEHPDVVLAELELEGGSGLQVVAAAPKPLPSILLSDFQDPVLEREARLLGAEYLLEPVSPAVLLHAVRQKLAAGPDVAFTPARRWQRRPLRDDWRVRVEDVPARLVDVSYGGMRLELERPPGGWLPLRMRLQAPAADAPVDVEVVWKRRSGETTWVCGAVVTEAYRPVWRRVVDVMAGADL